MIVKTWTTLRNNWKKSVAGVVALYYGVGWMRNRYAEDWLRRGYCQEAKKYGDVPLPAGFRPRKITVFLNPAAHDGKARKLFEKNAAPILYLSGMEVNVVKTEYEGQVKQFLSVVESKDTDGIIVAGGDGTLLETVTGFMRKEDKKFRNTIPIGVIPLGVRNKFAQLVYGTDIDNVKFICEAALAVVKGVSKKYDVMKIDGGGKTSYALCGMESGVYRDAEERKTKYWYFGPLKSRWTYIRSIMKEWPPSFKANISYVLATPENTRLTPVSQSIQPVQSSNGWFTSIFGRGYKKQEADIIEYEMDGSQDEAVEESIETVEFTINSSNVYKHPQNLPGLRIGIGPSEPSRMEVLTEGWRRISEKTFQLGREENKELFVKKIIFLPELEEDKESWINIDGEAFETIPLQITLLKDKLNVLYNPETPVISS